MLIEFKVANFRSIRDEQTLSLVANPADAELPDCVIDRELPGLRSVRFLRGAAIYGANASGKSNVLEAARYLAEFVANSATGLRPGESTGTQPFKLDGRSKDQPSEFEMTFVVEGVRYVFGLKVTPERVIEEYLVAYPKGGPQHWYTRTHDVKAKAYGWAKPAAGFKHDKSLQDKVRENSLFLSVGSQFNHPQLTPIYHWFNSSLRFIRLAAGMVNAQFTARLFAQPDYRVRLLNLLRSADIGIADAKVQERDVTFDEIRNNLPPALLRELEKSKPLGDIKSLELELTHAVEGVEPMALDYEEESAGTRAFFGLIGPWLDILDNGYTVFIDEIETSLHPILVRELLKLLFCRANNPKGAQVVFTTHNPLLLDKDLLRRDQIWFTEKSPEGATHLYPLTDYHPRKDEALAKGYLAGRYGGIPFIPAGLQL